MFNKLFLICTLFLLMQAYSLSSEIPNGRANLRWQANYEEALKQAKLNSKPLLIFFSGSDWCSWCTKLDEEALSTFEFASIIANKFIFVKIDFPLHASQDPKHKLQHNQLKMKFEVRCFPTIVLYDAQNNQTIASTGYQPGGGKLYGEHILELLNAYLNYKQKMIAIDKDTPSGGDLKQLYAQAMHLNLCTDACRIVEAGINSDQELYFMTERYRQYAADGQIHTPEAQILRQQLISADADNEKQIPYQVTMIDFAACSNEAATGKATPESEIASLNAYIEKYSDKDKDNCWRLEMIIAQIYLDHHQLPMALKHAQNSYETAPSSAQPEVAKFIQNIRGQIKETNG